SQEPALWFTLVLRQTGEFVGQCGIKVQGPKNRDGLFSISKFPKFFGGRSSGIVIGYAFGASGIQKVSLIIVEGNEAGIMLYTEIIQEGRKRRANWVEGHWEDLIYMGGTGE
ncbi:hypothetical protein BU15DRAFT_24765, partial [Melanogaster broomeanus]